jgi:acetyl-CoA C-acetyltransferase
MNRILIISARRTPIGTFNGGLASLAAPKLGALAISAALKDAGVDAKEVNECVMGQVLTSGVGQAPARQAALGAGLPNGVPCMTINKVCGSGLKSVMLGRDAIATGQAQIVVAGGQENMSQAPHLLEGSRAGFKMGPVTMADSMVKDGLWDPYNNWHMGNAAELCVREYKFTRAEQDAFAVESYRRAQTAQKEKWFAQEIAPVVIEDKKNPVNVQADEEPGKARFDKMPELRPAFEKEGTITAANASKINDGGAACVLASAERARELGLKALAEIKAQATFAQDPKWFTTAPVGAIKKALELAKLSAQDIDLWEINEAFSAVTMAAMRDLKIPHDKVNLSGGAVALGHPIGASGTRILTTLIHNLRRTKKSLGLATLCIGGGEAVAVIVEATA